MKKVLSYLLTLMLVVSGSIIPNTGNSHAQATTASKEVENITLAEENLLETCSSTFSRNSLTDEEKNIYDALLSVLKDAYAGNVTVVNDEYVDSSYGTCIGKIEGGDTCTVQNMVNAFHAVKNDYPLFFFWTNTFSAAGTDFYIYASEDYDTSSEILEGVTKVESFIKEAAKTIYAEAANYNVNAEFNIALAVNNYIIANTDYAYDENGKPSSAFDAHSIIGLVKGENVVCEGYAKGYMALAKYLGLDALITVGSGGGEDHAWNTVCIEGQYYSVDSTWNDTSDSSDYFLIGENEFYQTHSLDWIENSDLCYKNVLPDNMCNNNYSYEITADGFEYLGNGGCLTLTKYTGTDAHVTVPSQYNGINVRYVANEAFQYLDTLQTLTLSEGIYDLGMILSCENLKTIELPKTYGKTSNFEDIPIMGLEFGMASFCYGLDTIILAEDNPYVKLEDGVLYSKDGGYLICYPAAKKDTSYTAPSSLRIIGGGAISHNNYLKEIILNEGLITIDSWGIDGCINVEKVTLPSTLEQVGQFVLGGTKIKTLHIPSNLEFILSNAFTDNRELETITIDSNNTNCVVADNVLYCDNTAITCAPKSKETFIKVPDGVTMIANSAFVEIRTDKTIYLPNSVNKIENGAFNSSLITKLYIDGALPEFESNAFLNMDNITIVQHPDSEYTWSQAQKSEIKENNPNTNIIWSTDHFYDAGEVTTEATCTTSGERVYSCVVCGEKKQATIPVKEHTAITTTTPATLTSAGKITSTCSVCKKVISTTTIPRISSVKLSTTKYTYDGKIKTPTVIVKDSSGKTISSSYYTITRSSGRKYVGKYTYKITFKGKYKGTKTLSFVINPKGTSISSLTATSKGFNVKWKKQATQTTGYQIQYSTSSQFTNAKTITVTKNSTVSKAVSKLKAKQKYYIRIRTYKSVGSTKYYSGWSSTRYVTTKK